ncbi:MAG TPA: hypothetical protein VGL61_22930 [Kofleriaceae bacterium]
MRILLILLAACAPQLQTLQLVNQTPRTIEAVYVYPPNGSRGASRAQLAPNAQTSIQVRGGRVEVYAVSAKYQLDEHTRDRPEASQELELHGPAKVIFYDQDDRPAEVNRPDVFGIEFSPPKSHSTEGQ